jgi:hypothetical protein
MTPPRGSDYFLAFLNGRTFSPAFLRSSIKTRFPVSNPLQKHPELDSCLLPAGFAKGFAKGCAPGCETKKFSNQGGYQNLKMIKSLSYYSILCQKDFQKSRIGQSAKNYRVLDKYLQQ